MYEFISSLMREIAPVARRTSPSAAAVVGFVLGGIGLVLYFRASIIDLLLPVAFAIAVTVAFGEVGWFAGAVLASVYGFFRSQISNQSRQTQGQDLAHA